MNLEFDRMTRLISEVNNLLNDDSSSLLPLLNNAARLAGMCGDMEHKILFDIHIKGFKLNESGAWIKNQWPKGQTPKWDIAGAFKNDRIQADGNITGHSVQQIEFLKKEIYLNSKTDPKLLPMLFDLMEVTGRIRTRIGEFVRDTERELLLEQEQTTEPLRRNASTTRGKVFIGHGGSPLWKDLKDFLWERLKLPYDEFNREPSAGKSTKDRLEEMLEESGFAFLVMTAEDEHADETIHARENVVHEIGLFQGRLGFSKAIVLLEEGCAEFSNIHGLSQIRFPKKNILASSEEIRRVLEREGIL
jgi:predicted nucleotide-binding protein